MSGEAFDWGSKVLVPILTALLGAFLGAWFTLRRERRKAQAEKVKNAYETCLSLQELLAGWYSGIEEAVRFQGSITKTIENLGRFMQGLKFESQLKRHLVRLQGEPLCNELREKAKFFGKSALEGKGLLKRELESRFPRQYYDAEKDETLQFLKAQYADFEQELEKVTALLEAKQKRLL